MEDNMRKQLLIIFLFILFQNCDSSPNAKNSIANNKEESIDSIQTNKHDPSLDFFNSSEYAFELGKKSIFSSELEGVIINENALDITVTAEDQSFTNQPLKGSQDYDLNQIITQFPEFSIDTLQYDSITVYKLRFKNSIISLIEENSGLIPYSLIKDSEIPLNFGLKTGMDSDEVLNNLFHTNEIKGLKSLSKIEIEDLLGNFYMHIEFESNKLSAIKSGFHGHYLIEELKLKE
ncbi:MAG: hypothetical protein R3B93_28440 [Bacteroidia bacterium]